MTTATPIDLAAVKVRQQATCASGDFAEIATLIVPVAERLANAADLRAGSTVLDVASGSGNAAIAAARLGTVVTGIDFVPALLDRGRERAAAERLEIDLRRGDAEAIPFAAGSFDASLSVFGSMFAPDHRRAAGELVRVTRPGGTIALASWTPDGMVGEMFGIFGGYAAPAPPGPSPVRWGTPDGLRELFADGVTGIRTERCEFVLRAASPEAYVGFMLEAFGPALQIARSLDDERRKRLRADFVDLCQRYNRSPAAMATPAAYLRAVATRR
jgi:SAM-dependent methyltransferase